MACSLCLRNATCAGGAPIQPHANALLCAKHEGRFRHCACDSRVSVASDCESARADGAGVFKRKKQVVGFGEVLAHGSGALVGRGVPGGVGRGCRRGKRTDLGVKHILTTRHETFFVLVFNSSAE